MSTIATAESCTGGNLSRSISAEPGCSSYFMGSVVAYSNDIKKRVLGVPSAIIDRFGAVSQEVAEAMAIGVRDLMKSEFGISTTGVAGPSGGTPEKPVGTVWVAIASANQVISQSFEFPYDRVGNIRAATTAAFEFMENSFGLVVPHVDECPCPVDDKQA